MSDDGSGGGGDFDTGSVDFGPAGADGGWHDHDPYVDHDFGTHADTGGADPWHDAGGAADPWVSPAEPAHAPEPVSGSGLDPVLFPDLDVALEVVPAVVPGFGYDPHDGGVVGDTFWSEQHWHEQERPDTCAIEAQGMVLADLTGSRPTEAELTAVAQEHHWYLPGGGTPQADVGLLLEHYGLDAHTHENAGLADIEHALSEGKGVIAAVSATVLDGPPGPDTPLAQIPGLPVLPADHAVQVIGVDRTDPGSPVVVLNDPGQWMGEGARVPLHQFLDSWAGSGHYLVTASRPDTTQP
ncbi:hypothetical protein ACFW1A_01260 [Kitasatospora sp. NPDC058965]|uniref:hypothetical protein n=1 Tax=Kitasatospora sp. NPDC058965 TaxID=3346682 RepID=UPI0036C907DF